MDENPYKSPSAKSPARLSVAWRRITLLGLAVMLVSALALGGTGNFHRGGVTFHSAWLAVFLAGTFCAGAVVLIGSGIGWLIAGRFPDRRLDRA